MLKSLKFYAAYTNFAENKYFFKTIPIIWLVLNLGYTTSKVNKRNKGCFQRKPMTFCELTNIKLFEGFRKSLVENHASKKCFFYGKYHKKNVFFYWNLPLA